uniref:Paired domain-containing protein n=1 Tax=Panagrellus redivivus TaxID=6233 RepID=A0A7E4W5B3_PANRE
MPIRIEIVQRHLEGQKVTSIARDLKLSHGVISKIVRNFEKTGSCLPQNIRFNDEVMAPQQMPSFSTPAPMPEPDVAMADPVATTAAKDSVNFTVDALLQTPAAPPNPTLPPVTKDEPKAPALPFSISSILAPTPAPEPAAIPKWPHDAPPPTFETVQVIPPPEVLIQLQVLAMQMDLLPTFK